MKLKTGLVALSLSFFGNGAANAATTNLGMGVNLGVSGFFSPVVEEVEVTRIQSNSPAEKAGLQVGDKIIAINDEPVNGWSAKQAELKMTKQPGEQLPIKVEKADGSQLSTTIVLA